jgi:uncharacterized protein
MFEFDPAKSDANRAKHGIDFDEAQALWLDQQRVEIPARSSDEPRFGIVGMIGDKLWTAFCTIRDDRVRVISVRRSRQDEVAGYGNQDNVQDD